MVVEKENRDSKFKLEQKNAPKIITIWITVLTQANVGSSNTTLIAFLSMSKKTQWAESLQNSKIFHCSRMCIQCISLNGSLHQIATVHTEMLNVL